MQWEKIVRGSIIGLLIAYVPLGIIQSSDGFGGIWIISLPIGAFFVGYFSGNKTEGAICGLIVNLMLLFFANILISEGSLAGIVILILWIVLLAPLTLLDLLGGYIAVYRRQNTLEVK